LPRLRNRELLRMLPMILLVTAACGVVGGVCGYAGYLTRLDNDFVEMVRSNIFRPQRFMCAWGVHLGGYAGGAIGTLLAAGRVIRLRGLKREDVKT
jgi:membrane associated rhomboid family serine protease